MGGRALLKKGREIQDDITRPAPPLTARQRQRREALERESRELAKNPFDLPFCILVILLTGVGLIMLLSASFPSAYYETKNHDPTYYFARQAVFAAAGLVGMLAISRMNYQRLRGVAKPLMYVTVVLLVLVLIPGIGQVRNHARRWIGIGQVLTFQPSEIAKAAVVIYFADSISKKRDKMRSFKEGIQPYALWLILLGGLVVREPHLSGAILIMGAGAVQMLVGGIHLGWVAGALGAAASGLYFILFVIGYNTSRITAWLDPWEDPGDTGFQLSQSLISIGSGGLLGVGLGKSRQKFLYLPEEHNDFIFAVTCEELGFIGASIIILLFAALILRGYWIALHARDRFGSLLVVGIVTLVAMQTFLNIGVVTGLLPTTGISLPFFSYGGTAILIQLAEMGIVLSVSRQMKIGEK
ncbi:MAG: putative lipid II flippase FtsW [Oscillibacter sp.]|nr:putative lipid II flippase FtsW [Oscillibacter sp.]